MSPKFCEFWIACKNLKGLRNWKREIIPEFRGRIFMSFEDELEQDNNGRIFMGLRTKMQLKNEEDKGEDEDIRGF